jgi:coenzyme F420 hydrogenase subunit delta
MLKRIYEKPRLVFGCGNPLFGDDGFGAEVIRLLEAEYRLPSDVAYLDVGTAVRDILFDMLLSRKYPRQIIIVDAMALKDASPGEIREIGLDEIQPAKIVDYSLHQFPTTNMLKELRQRHRRAHSGGQSGRHPIRGPSGPFRFGAGCREAHVSVDHGYPCAPVWYRSRRRGWKRPYVSGRHSRRPIGGPPQHRHQLD